MKLIVIKWTFSLEIALRQVDPDVALPYWDSTLDQNLPDARDSVLWSSDFFGDSDSAGNVVNGPFANWRTVQGRDNILRQIGGQASLFTENELNTVLQQVKNGHVLRLRLEFNRFLSCS